MPPVWYISMCWYVSLCILIFTLFLFLFYSFLFSWYFLRVLRFDSNKDDNNIVGPATFKMKRILEQSVVHVIQNIILNDRAFPRAAAAAILRNPRQSFHCVANILWSKYYCNYRVSPCYACTARYCVRKSVRPSIRHILPLYLSECTCRQTLFFLW